MKYSKSLEWVHVLLGTNAGSATLIWVILGTVIGELNHSNA